MAIYLIVGPVLSYLTFGGLALWTFLYRRHRMRRMAAAEVASSA